MSKLLLHLGFHKTGTTSLQRFFGRNRDHFASDFSYIGRPESSEIARFVRRFSNDFSEEHLAWLRFHLVSVLEPYLQEQNRVILLSDEDLSGRLPGRGGVCDYRQAPILAEVIARTLKEDCGVEGAEFYYSTRDEFDWHKSAYAHILRETSLTESFDEFKARICPELSFANLLQDIQSRIAPFSHRLVEYALDEDHSPMRPFTKLLDLLGIEEERLKGLELPHFNRKQDDALNIQLLAINRSELGEKEKQRARKALLRGA